jgi:fluoride exporter
VITWIAMTLAGSLGAVTRFRLSLALNREYPWGTLAINLSGAFALGVLTGAGVGGDALRICGTGFMGGYTTFSTWMVETRRVGLGYLAVSMVAGLAAAALGYAIA